MLHASRIIAILRSDPARWRLLEIVRELELPDSWIAAGFVRNAVWDHLHGRAPAPIDGDVDVIWFDAGSTDAALDRELERRLHTVAPGIDWSVKNQARMHVRNGDQPYTSASDAMRHWPETATAVAAKLEATGECRIASPLGLDDLFDLRLRPTARFAREKHAIFAERVQSKAWLSKWPLLGCAEV
ncbi:nucleotidyltransferase family protein [Novosphingobium aquimarinum]|uniref:nucleotidyltransferase family protein n=1 Tax=Novosphingobium aquimarinum TaxID=2682494 RepID=UPI0012EBAF34|nr:nucleotidyltransferase family protein [Novosphingobium aquimarinum]